ncbi:MAG: acyl-CoA dehydratase activase [Christensenellales bacterium]|jgi:predicted CoA-substrate-specific enzyme activase
MIDYVCKYAPVEILAGFNIESKLYNPVADNFDGADKLTHRNMCSFSRALIQKRIQGNGKMLLLTDCCDSIRRACDVLQEYNHRVFMLNLPHKEDNCARELYKHTMIQFIDDFTHCSGRLFDHEKFRSACKQNITETKGPYVSVMGARLSGELMRYIEKTSNLPVVNNTCTGIRRVGESPLADDLETLMDWYAGELLSQLPCMRMTNIASRRTLADDPNIKGIVYNTVSFCDFYGLEYAQIKKTLTVPVLKIETDYTSKATAQFKNRLDAFFESLNIEKKKTPLHRNPKKRYALGIDSGSASTNAVILDANRNIVSYCVLPTGVNVADSMAKAFDDVLQKAQIAPGQILRVVTTGYGRTSAGFGDRDITEITCHARAAYFLNPRVRSVIDIGGQDSKVIRLDESGAVKDFIMNDKCAAGTGRFLEMMAQSLGITLKQISTCGLKWNEDIPISSMCSVFAQSEVVSLLAAGKKLEDIIHGINASVASKVIVLCERVGREREFMMTGGVAKNIGVVRAIEEKLATSLYVSEKPEICGALGAALIAIEG